MDTAIRIDFKHSAEVVRLYPQEVVLPLAGNTPRDLSLSPVLTVKPPCGKTRTALDTVPQCLSAAYPAAA